MKASSNSQSGQSGYRMLPEWQPHAATWLAWPHNKQTWPNNLIEAQREFVALAVAIADGEPVVIIASGEPLELAKSMTGRSTEFPITFLDIATNDAWIRDYGPTFVENENSQIAVDWCYNAWGGKYPPYEDDQKVVEEIVKALSSRSTKHLSCKKPSPNLKKIDRTVSKLCIEGGAIEVNANGLLLCTRSCALDRNRNLDWTTESIENEFRHQLGVSDIIWLSGGAIEGDDTDGHIDQLARFVPDNRVVFAWARNRQDPQYAALRQNRLELVSGFENLALEVELIELPLPEPVVFDGNRLPASYCNYYITNRSVIVPQFGQATADDQAVGILSDLFSDRNVFGLPSLNLNVGLGSFHCLTQQQPAERI